MSTKPKQQTFARIEAAQVLNQRPERFCEWLERSGYTQMKGIPAQRYIDQGLFVLRSSDDGMFHGCHVTEDGIEFFAEKLDGITL